PHVSRRGRLLGRLTAAHAAVLVVRPRDIGAACAHRLNGKAVALQAPRPLDRLAGSGEGRSDSSVIDDECCERGGNGDLDHCRLPVRGLLLIDRETTGASASAPLYVRSAR